MISASLPKSSPDPAALRRHSRCSCAFTNPGRFLAAASIASTTYSAMGIAPIPEPFVKISPRSRYRVNGWRSVPAPCVWIQRRRGPACTACAIALSHMPIPTQSTSASATAVMHSVASPNHVAVTSRGRRPSNCSRNVTGIAIRKGPLTTRNPDPARSPRAASHLRYRSAPVPAYRRSRRPCQ